MCRLYLFFCLSSTSRRKYIYIYLKSTIKEKKNNHVKTKVRVNFHVSLVPPHPHPRFPTFSLMFYTHRSEQRLREQDVNTVHEGERSILSQAAGEQGGEVTQANTRLVTQGKEPMGRENRAAPFRLSPSHQSSPNKSKWSSDLVPLTSWRHLLFSRKEIQRQQHTHKARVHFWVSHDFCPI